MPTKTFLIGYELGPLIQYLLLQNPEVTFAGYHRPVISIKDTLIEVRTKKVDPKAVFEDTLLNFMSNLGSYKVE